MQNDVVDMLYECWHGMIWLDANVDTLHVKRISLNDP
jgi:hypothetical protein